MERVQNRRRADKHHSYVVSAYHREMGTVSWVGDSNKGVALGNYSKYCDKYPSEKGFRVELRYNEYLGSKVVYSRLLDARLPGKPQK